MRIVNVRNKIEDIGNCIKSTDNYLEKYQPFNWFCTIFEIVRLALDPIQFLKVKDYEEYRLKEMYELILSDSGESNFDKKFTMKPMGYSLLQLKNSHVKLN
jgi:hypothetical protein